MIELETDQLAEDEEWIYTCDHCDGEIDETDSRWPVPVVVTYDKQADKDILTQGPFGLRDEHVYCPTCTDNYVRACSCGEYYDWRCFEECPQCGGRGKTMCEKHWPLVF